MEQRYVDLTNNRKKLIEAFESNDCEEGIKNLLTNIYPDDAHFIYELLQNAEDTNATQVSFILKKNGIVFIHNGNRKFDFQDIEAITNIARTTKTPKDKINPIGKFGVGFKSVFAYTDRPQIFSDDMSFAIEELVLPIFDIDSEINFRDIFAEDKNSDKTYMYFPFKNEQIEGNNGYNEIKKRLENIGHTTLLFIKNIKEIQFKIERNEQHDEKEIILERINKNHNKIEIADTENKPSSWLRFRQFFTLDKNENIIKTNDTTGNLFVSIAFWLDNEKLRPIQHNDAGTGQVSIYFPADKETSSLRFHIHAPFSSTVARSDINDQPINKNLISLLAELCANSILEIKNLGLLTNEIFEILPLKNELSPFYSEIYEKIKEVYNDEALLIIDNDNHRQENKYASASSCYKVMNKSVKDFFTVGMLNHIYDENREFNIINPLNNSRMDKFINDLDNLLAVNQDEIVEKFANKLRIIKNEHEKFFNFLAALDNNKIKNIFIFLQHYKSKNLTVGANIFNNFKKIIRFKHNGVEKLNIDDTEPCYFYIGNTNRYPKYKIVNSEIYDGSDDAKSFLSSIGVKELTSIQELRLKTTNIERHIEIWNELLDKENTVDDVISLFGSSYPLVYSKDNCLRAVGKILMFEIISFTGYHSIHELYKQYIKEYEFFCNVLEHEHMGAKSTIPIVPQLVKDAGYPEIRTLYEYKERIRRNDETNKDFTLGGLKRAENVSGIFKEYNHLDKHIEICKLIISTINTAKDEHQRASYQPNSKQHAHNESSSMVISLRDARWLINDKGERVKPREVTLETIHPQLKEDLSKVNISWLKAINFNNNGANQTEQNHLSVEEYVVQIVQMVKDGQITREDLDSLAQRKIEENTQPTEKSIYEINLWSAFESHDKEIKPEEGIEFKHSTTIIHDPEKYMERYRDEYVKLLKTVRREHKIINISTPYGKDKVRSFLYENYQGICQICGFTFKKKDNKNYFKIFDWGSNKITHQDNRLAMSSNSLCLCGKCHSILKHGSFRPIFMDKLKSDLQSYDVNEMLSNYKIILTGSNNPGLECFTDHYGLKIELLDEPQIIHYKEEHFISLIATLKLNMS